MVEEYEETIIDWFKNNQHIPPLNYICDENILQRKSKSKRISFFCNLILSHPFTCILSTYE